MPTRSRANEVCVIDLAVPFLLGLDILPQFGIILDFISGHMRAKDGQWNINFHYRGEHAFVATNNPRAFMWSRSELGKLH